MCGTLRLLTGLSTALTAIAFTLGAHAADIIWQTPADETGSTSDIVVIGAPFDAVTANAGGTVGGVVFRGPAGFASNTLTFGAGSKITVSGLKNGHATFGALPPAAWDSNYRSLVYGGGFARLPATPAINLTGLIFGTQYTVQIFESFWDIDWATTFTGGANTSLPVKTAGPAMAGPAIEGAPAASVAQYVIGTFIADGPAETIWMNSPTNFAIFDAIQVRTEDSFLVTSVAAPEPSSLAIGFSAAAILGVVRRRRTTKAA